MTCIVGYVDKNDKNDGNDYNKIYIGGDSAGSSNYTTNKFKNKKVFIKKNMIFGFTSSYRMGQIIEYCFDIPIHVYSKSSYEYICDDFMSHLIKCFEKHGYLMKDDDGQYKGGSLLLGYRGRLYKLQSNYSIIEPIENFHADGSGDEYALGALNILDKTKLRSEEKVRQALLTSEKFAAGVSGPFTIMNI